MHRTASFDVFGVDVRGGVLAAGDGQNQKNSRVNNRRELAHAWKRNPLSDLDKILQGGRYRRRNHLHKFRLRSVKGFRGGGESKFALLH